MKKIIGLFLFLIILLSPLSSVAYIKTENVNIKNGAQGISDIIKVQCAVYNQTKRFILDIGDIISKDVSAVLSETSHKKDLSFSANDNIFYTSEKSSIASPILSFAKTDKGIAFHGSDTSALMLILFILITFLIKYLGLLRLFYANNIIKINILLKTHKFNLCVFYFGRSNL